MKSQLKNRSTGSPGSVRIATWSSPCVPRTVSLSLSCGIAWLYGCDSAAESWADRALPSGLAGCCPPPRLRRLRLIVSPLDPPAPARSRAGHTLLISARHVHVESVQNSQECPSGVPGQPRDSRCAAWRAPAFWQPWRALRRSTSSSPATAGWCARPRLPMSGPSNASPPWSDIPGRPIRATIHPSTSSVALIV